MSVDSTALLGLLADIRAAVGDRNGKLMQDELVEHCRKLARRAAAKQQSRKAGYVGPAIWHRCEPHELVKSGKRLKWEYFREDVEVEVMAQVGRYLMIRRPGCMPFVATTKQVTFAPPAR